MIEDAKEKARTIIEKAKEEASVLKETTVETTTEAKALANEALEKTKAKSHELAQKVKAAPQVVKQGIEDKYVYTKKAVNESYEKGKDTVSDVRIHAAIKYAFLTSKNVHSMKIDVDVKDGFVELFGKVKSIEEAEEAMLIALSTKGVWAVNSFFAIRD